MSNTFFQGGEKYSRGDLPPLATPWLRACYPSNFDYGSTTLVYLIKHIPAVAFANIKGVLCKCKWIFVDFYDARLTLGLWLRLRISDPFCSWIITKGVAWQGSRRGAATWLEFLFSMAVILAAKRKMETDFDSNPEDVTIGQWFSNFSLLGTLSLHPKPLRSPSFCQSFFDYW